MQLKKEEYQQLYRLIDKVRMIAFRDYTYSGDISVVNINGMPLIFDRIQLNMLDGIRRQIEKEM